MVGVHVGDAELRSEVLLNRYRREIYDCLKRVGRGIDRFDLEIFLSAYHSDAIIDAGKVVADPKTVFDLGAAIHSEQVSTLHHLTNHTCDLQGETAHCETYFIYVGRNPDGTIWQSGGRYIDRLELRDGAWRIAFRYTIVEWSGLLQPTPVPLFEGVDYGDGNGVPSRTRTDPSYRRPLVNLRERTTPADGAAEY
jgi:hypothetical protein